MPEAHYCEFGKTVNQTPVYVTIPYRLKPDEAMARWSADIAALHSLETGESIG